MHATLPGQSDERIVLITHTDGNTWVQENGIAALLAIGQYVARRPAGEAEAHARAHLHVSASAHLPRGLASLLGSARP